MGASRLHPSFAPDFDDTVAAWRRAFRAAKTAVEDADLLPVQERRERLAALNAQLTATETLLRLLAREEHIPPQPVVVSPYEARRHLALPPDVAACVFALDGALVPSADLHVAAWTRTFGDFLLDRAERTHGGFRPFDPRLDYVARLHGRPRLDGVRSFLESRGIRLPEGSPSDPPGTESVYGLANRKTEVLLRLLDGHGVVAFAGSHSYLELAHEAGIRCAVVSASANTPAMLDRAGLSELVDAVVDGEVIRRHHLRVKPAPDTLLAACRQLGVEPERAAAFETTRAGVLAAHEAGVHLVVGVDGATGADTRDSLWATGADVVVGAIGELLDHTPALSARRRVGAAA